jgi:hypothetical protein
MSQITLRGLDEEAEKKIRNMAKKKRQSLNKVILEMICQHKDLGLRGKAPAGESLRNLAGGWSRKEADDLLKHIKACEQIDEAMWK